MPLTDLQKERIAQFVPMFKAFLSDPVRGKADLQARKERIDLYADLLSSEGIVVIDEQNFGKLISTLWSFAMWGNKSYLLSKILKDNPLEELKPKLSDLLYGDSPLEERFDHFRQETTHFGPATISELLSFVHPDECGLWNKRARDALEILGFSDAFPFLNTYQISGQQYVSFNALLRDISQELAEHQIVDLDLLGVDYFLYEVQKYPSEIQIEEKPVGVNEVPEKLEDFNHDEAIEQLLTIGQWLGFEVEKEKTIAHGARVDVIWQARVANLGVVTYVFEVQRRGNVDALILNLQRAQNNPTVQRLVVVGLEDELTRVRNEVNTLREDFRRMVGYMDISDLLRATDLVSELSNIINKLELVKSEFGT